MFGPTSVASLVAYLRVVALDIVLKTRHFIRQTSRKLGHHVFQIAASLHAKHGQVVDGINKVLPTKTRLSGDQVHQTSAGHVGAELAARSRRGRVRQTVARGAEPQAGQCPRALVTKVDGFQGPGNDSGNPQGLEQSAGDLGGSRQVVGDRSLDPDERHRRSAPETADGRDAVDRGRLNAGGSAVEVDSGKETVEEPRDAGDDVNLTACDILVYRCSHSRRGTTIIYASTGLQRSF